MERYWLLRVVEHGSAEKNEENKKILRLKGTCTELSRKHAISQVG